MSNTESLHADWVLGVNRIIYWDAHPLEQLEEHVPGWEDACDRSLKELSKISGFIECAMKATFNIPGLAAEVVAEWLRKNYPNLSKEEAFTLGTKFVRYWSTPIPTGGGQQ